MMNIFDGKGSISLRVCMVLFFAFFVTSPFLTELAMAEDNLEIVTVLCNAVKELTGAVGKSIAILIVISLAIALFLGKVTWGVAIAVAVGMGVLFGAPGIVNILSGDGGEICP